MKTFLLSATGVIFLSVIISLLIPEGKLNKTITFIMRLICIMVMIQPLTEIFGIKDSASEASRVDYVYVCEIYSEHQSGELEKLILENLGARTKCSVEVVYEDDEFKVDRVTVSVEENNSELIKDIYEYLGQLQYINITVYAEST
ncbi:MAG: stage III sporulation protein AF [Clostridiales bacterium]|nr:stage III sporulation protein AF [Clostridiales bacterium]